MLEDFKEREGIRMSSSKESQIIPTGHAFSETAVGIVELVGVREWLETKEEKNSIFWQWEMNESDKTFLITTKRKSA